MAGRIVGTFIIFTSLVGALAGTARGEEPWPGSWRIDGRPGARTLDPDGEHVLFDLVLDRGSASCRATVRRDRLEFDGMIFSSVGLVGALEERRSDRPLQVRGTVTRTRPTVTGEETAEAVFFLEGREVLRERWTRPGTPELQVVALEGFGAGGLDPTRERLTVRVRVLGRAQEVTLTAQVPDADRARASFYRREGVDPRRVARTTPVRLEPGEHALEWDGRDRGGSGRIALQGAWTIVVDSAERAARRPAPAPLRVQVTVPRPWLQCVEPRFEQHSKFPIDALDRLRSDFVLRYALAPTRTRLGSDAFVAALGHAAVGVVVTHGQEAQLALGDWTGPIGWFGPGDLPAGKPLRDVHAVFVFSCRTGATDADEQDLPRALVAAGVDVVVSSTETLLIAEAKPFHDSIGARLLGYGHPIARAALDAAKFAHDQVWGAVDETRRQGWLDHHARIRSLHHAGVLRFATAPGVDASTELLVPARYGRANN